MAGTLLLYHPLQEPRRYNQTDRFFREACCGTSDQLCGMYIERRPINNCDGYQPPEVCKWAGAISKNSEILKVTVVARSMT